MTLTTRNAYGLDSDQRQLVSEQFSVSIITLLDLLPPPIKHWHMLASDVRRSQLMNMILYWTRSYSQMINEYSQNTQSE